MRMRLGATFVAAIVGGAVAVCGETRLTVDTASGSPGDRIVIRAGYNVTTPVHSIDSSGRLLLNGQIDVYVLYLPTVRGDFTGFYGTKDETQLELTSDYFAATGRLNGGDFRYEITSVQPVPGGGGSPDVRFGYGATGEGFEAFSDAPVRDGRSLELGVGNLYDDEVMYANRPGFYDVSIVAWDANGRYADSAPVTFRVDVIPEPAIGLVGLGAAMLLRHRRR